jgi:hypothetical protein
MEFPYRWTWRWRTWELPGGRFRAPWFGDGVDRTGQACRVVTRGTRNSALLEFEDGYRVITSRGGLRRAPSSSSVAVPNPISLK